METDSNFIDSLQTMRVAVVVAHPDDECLFFGNLISRIKVDMYCCMVAYQDPIRFSKFFDVCKKVYAFPYVLYWFNFDLIDLSTYDIVFTHNRAGEYGHEKHKLVHNFVKSSHDNVYTNCYGINDEPDFVIEGDEKFDLIKSYDYQHEGRLRWEPLIQNFGSQFNLRREAYVRV